MAVKSFITLSTGGSGLTTDTIATISKLGRFSIFFVGENYLDKDIRWSLPEWGYLRDSTLMVGSSPCPQILD